MTDTAARDALDERFTIYCNAKGKPVQRTLREMTADEVMEAIEWNGREADRLEKLAAPYLHRRSPAEAFEAGEITDAEMVAQTEHGVALLQASAAAFTRSANLERAVLAALNHLPEAAKDQPIVRVLRRYWPGGRRRDMQHKQP
jgi:hypothetical protein